VHKLMGRQINTGNAVVLTVWLVPLPGVGILILLSTCTYFSEISYTFRWRGRHPHDVLSHERTTNHELFCANLEPLKPQSKLSSQIAIPLRREHLPCNVLWIVRIKKLEKVKSPNAGVKPNNIYTSRLGMYRLILATWFAFRSRFCLLTVFTYPWFPPMLLAVTSPDDK